MKKKAQPKYHGKTLEEILNGNPNLYEVDINDKKVNTVLFDPTIKTSHIHNFNLDYNTNGELGEVKKFKFDSTGEAIEDIRERNKLEKMRRDNIVKAEMEGMFEAYAKGVLSQIKDIRGCIKKLMDTDDEFTRADPMDRFTYLATKYQGFSHKHPIVLQKIAVDGLYSDKAFKKYLKKEFAYKQKLSRGEIRREHSRDEHFKLQADYARLLYMQSKGWNPNEAARIWSAVYKAFKTEDTEFKDKEKEVKEIYAKEDEEKELALKKELTASIRSHSEELLNLLQRFKNGETIMPDDIPEYNIASTTAATEASTEMNEEAYEIFEGDAIPAYGRYFITKNDTEFSDQKVPPGRYNDFSDEE